jgi:hypothetical protein
MTRIYMKTNLIIVLLTVVAFTLAVSGCYEDNEQDLYINIPTTGGTTQVSFKQDIQPIFNNSCTSGCHSGTSPSANISLDSYNGIYAAPILRIRGSIQHDPGYSPMPKNAPSLSADNLAIIDKWINQGFPNN